MTDAEIARLRALADHVYLDDLDDTWTPSRTAQAMYMAAAMRALPAALDEIERLRAQLHAPLRDWTPDLKRWLADVLLREASEVDGDEPRPSREMVYELRLKLAKTHRCPECDATCRSCATCGYQFG